MLAAISGSGVAARGQDGQDQQARPALTSSAYPPVPADLAQLWLVPDRATKAHVTAAMSGLAEAARLIADAKYQRALPLVTARGLAGTPLADYATYFKGVILLRQARLEEARAVFDELRAKEPVGYLAEAVQLRDAETAEARGDHAAAAQIYDELMSRRPAGADAVLEALAKSAEAAGDRERAARAWQRLYYDYPVSDLASTAGNELERLRDALPADPAARYRMDAVRAQRLFDNRRYPAAESAFAALVPQATGDDRERFELRLAESRFYLHRYREARDGAQKFIEHAARKAEAQFFYVSTLRELGQQEDYVRLTRELAAEFPTSSWTEEALNALASNFIVNDQDDRADQVFREMYARFPKGKYAERAAWKIGWWAYKHANYQDTATFFEEAAANFPHSDSRPAYLYWSARAHEALGERDVANARYRLALTDYRNTYYGHLAAPAFAKASAGKEPEIEPVAIVAPASAGASAGKPANAEQIRMLLAVGLTDQAIDEMQYAQRAWGDSPVITATLAWARNQAGDLRAAITLMKRAYPQYMAAGGENLPIEIRKVMYPVDYWTSIKKQAESRHLDPYLVASLILQESTFSPAARSSANAVGLMQLVASTGRHYARSLRIRRFTPVMLTRPDTNLRLGLAYFADLMNRFGADYLALASYNAGENRIAQWIAERPGLSREEFIDDIPFPETQNYVKRIVSAAVEYRRLYGDGSAGSTQKKAPAKKAATKKKTAGKRSD